MKKGILIAACAMPLLLSSVANAGMYVSGNIGLGILNDSDTDFNFMGFPVTATFESEEGLALGVAAGYAFGNARIEGEYAYQQNDFETLEVSVLGFSASTDISGETSSNSFLFNTYYDFKNSSSFTPFLTAGLGVSNVEGELEGDTEDDTVFAYQLGAGLGYAVNDKFSIDFKYRYFGTDDPEFDGFDFEYSSHNLYLGARFSF